MKVTVTGASGFVGNAVCRDLHALGWTVRGIVRQRVPQETPDWEVIQGDLLDEATIKTAVGGADIVVHAAGLVHVPPHRQIEQQFLAQNVEVTERMARMAADVGVRLIYISSEAARAARTPYGRSKRLAEERLEEIGRARGLQWTVVRPALLFGEGDPGNFLRLLVAVARRRFIYIDGGRARKSVTYVGNVGPAIAAIAQYRAAHGRRYYLADPRPYTIREIIAVVSDRLGAPEPRLSLAAPVARAIGRIGSLAASAGLAVPLRRDVVETLTRDVVVDTGPLEQDTGFCPPIPFPEGVRRTVEWCRHARIVS